jgi:hypothetical protein
MSVIVLQEMGKQVSADFGPGGAEPYIKSVHAAPADPAVPGDPAEETFCGKPTSGMERLPYKPHSPGDHWYPHIMSRWVCPECEQALSE